MVRRGAAVAHQRIAIYAQGTYSQHDFIVGLIMFLLVMELTRLAHPILFWTNIFLVVYTLWGYLSPIDFLCCVASRDRGNFATPQHSTVHL